ncbi:7532_t:CDS:2 [Paraglomus brasilianum]|uniref:7532_t:CDS:1 n=1 Tax=Paraglomus brasilianum TaxID=144538 RepID=A0A9N9DL10_9GLOM|nr:7532_t:CDS:2 [Paraglomus brasilianum]
MSTPIRPISDIYTDGRIKKHPSLSKQKPSLPPRTQKVRAVIEENDQRPSVASPPALPPRETKTAADFYNSSAKSKSDLTEKKKKRTSLFRISMAFMNRDGSQKNDSDEKDVNVLSSSTPPPALPPRPSVPRSLQKYKRWNRLSSVSPADKALPSLPPPIILGKGSDKFYRKFDILFAKKFPKVYIYRHALYVGFGLFLLGLLVIIICAGAGLFAQDHGGKGANSSGNGDVGTGGLGLSGSGDGTYYDPGIGTGSCGTLHTGDELVAALNAPQYGTFANPNDSPVCGKCVEVTGPKGTVKVKIVDKCPVCKNGDIDLSPAAFDKIADEAVGRVPVTWKGC